MSKSRKFRKIILKSEVALLEEEEFDDQFHSFGPEFDQDFQQEIAFLKQKQSAEIIEKIETPQKDEEVVIPDKVSYEFLKSLHKELVIILHPDKNKDCDGEEFKKMQSAYEAGDAAVLIEERIELKNKKIKKGKSSCRWVWCSSDKNDVIKSMIRSSLGIDEEEFKEWLTKNKE